MPQNLRWVAVFGFSLKDERGARIVADNLGYTNEAHVCSDGAWLYVNETFGRRLARFRIAADGSLGNRETVATFGKGTFPDGLAFDDEGGVWIASIVSNRVIRVASDGSQQLILEDADEAHIDGCEQAFLAGTMGRTHMDACGGRYLKNISRWTCRVARTCWQQPHQTPRRRES